MSDRQIVKSVPGGDPAVQRGLLLLPPLNAVLELALFVVVVLGVDAFVPSFSLNGIEPNPSWLPVLLLSVQYGTVSGLLAAATCIALSLQTGFPDQDVGENLFVYLLRAWAQPMLWIGAAVLLGQFRTRHIAERAELTQEMATLSSQRTAIAEYATNLRARCDALERHLASRDGPAPVALLAELARIGAVGRTGRGTTPAADLTAAFRAAITAVLPGARASLMLIEPAAVRLAATTGGHDDSPPADGPIQQTEPSAALLHELDVRRRPISVLTPDGERLLAGSALVAVPVEVGDGIGAVILLRNVDPPALTGTLISGLPVLAAALAPAVEATLLSGASAHTGQTTVPAHSDVQAANGSGTLPWLKRLWKPRQAPAPVPVARTTRPDPPTRRLVR